MVDRIVRVNSLIHREIGMLLEKLVEVKQYGLLTVTEVRVSRDLRHAKVFISVFGNQDQKLAALSFLKKKRTLIQREICKVIVLKRMPALMFSLDETAEKNVRLLEIFNQLDDEKEITPP
ncbi:MAG: 30S ribosome-binding factor RbfA [Chlamydiota bacterium]|nr:30S ribosome-binding factor RbfA [Chlamydiota bacterium]